MLSIPKYVTTVFKHERASAKAAICRTGQRSTTPSVIGLKGAMDIMKYMNLSLSLRTIFDSRFELMTG